MDMLSIMSLGVAAVSVVMSSRLSYTCKKLVKVERDKRRSLEQSHRYERSIWRMKEQTYIHKIDAQSAKLTLISADYSNIKKTLDRERKLEASKYGLKNKDDNKNNLTIVK